MRTTVFACDRCGADCTADPGRAHLAIAAGALRGRLDSDRVDLCGPCAAAALEWLARAPRPGPPPGGGL